MGNTKRYPTRMHEVLGVGVAEEATYKSTTKELKDFRFFVDEYGSPRYPSRLLLDGYDMANIINHPERIIRKPRLTEEQVAMLKAAWTLGARYIAREGNSGLRLSDNAPLVLMGGRLKITGDSLTMYIESYGNPLVDLVKQSDPEPLDIVQTLRDAGRLEDN